MLVLASDREEESRTAHGVRDQLAEHVSWPTLKQWEMSFAGSGGLGVGVAGSRGVLAVSLALFILD